MNFLIDIQGAPTPLRLVNYDQPITHHGANYVPFPIEVDMLEEATSASLVHMRLTVENVSQQVVALLENYWRDTPRWTVTIWEIDAVQPDQTPLHYGNFFVVQNAVTDTVVCVFDVVAEGYTLSMTLPGRRYTATGGFPDLVRR